MRYCLLDSSRSIPKILRYHTAEYIEFNNKVHWHCYVKLIFFFNFEKNDIIYIFHILCNVCNVEFYIKKIQFIIYGDQW